MPDRIDALEEEPRGRFAALRGAALSDASDPELEAIVREVAAVVGTPIAAVSLVLERTQLFRAHTGLPADLAVVGATDRDVSFCQFVVRTRAMFEVSDATTDPRVPRALVDRYGVRAYLGAPIRTGEHVVGSLCALDVVPRAFEAPQRARLTALAERAGRRLAELAREEAGAPPLAAVAAEPALAELRNRLTPVRMSLDAARVSVAELGALRRLVAQAGAEDAGAAAVLARASEAIVDVARVVRDLDRAVTDIAEGVAAVQQLLAPSRAPGLFEVVEAATRLAHHHTKLVGGVRTLELPTGVRLRAPRALAVSVLGAVLSTCARGATSTPTITARLEDGRAYVLVEACLPDAEAHARAEGLALALGDDPRVALRAAGGGVEIAFACESA